MAGAVGGERISARGLASRLAPPRPLRRRATGRRPSQLPAGRRGAENIPSRRFYPLRSAQRARHVSQRPSFTIRRGDPGTRPRHRHRQRADQRPRLSGKSNGVLTELGRIPASNVVRIEIRDAATLDGRACPARSPTSSSRRMRSAASSPGVRNSASASPIRCYPRRGLGQRQARQVRLQSRPPENSVPERGGRTDQRLRRHGAFIERRDELDRKRRGCPGQRSSGLGRAGKRSQISTRRCAASSTIIASSAPVPARASSTGFAGSPTTRTNGSGRSAATMKSRWSAAGSS